MQNLTKLGYVRAILGEERHDPLRSMPSGSVYASELSCGSSVRWEAGHSGGDWRTAENATALIAGTGPQCKLALSQEDWCHNQYQTISAVLITYMLCTMRVMILVNLRYSIWCCTLDWYSRLSREG